WRDMRNAMDLMVLGLKGEVDLAALDDGRYALGEATRHLGEKGLSKHNVPPQTFPPGTFLRPLSAKRSNNDPGTRVGWMAGLLPYMGHDALYHHIHFDKSWKDAENWLAARTIVPQFLDPSFPVHSRYVAYPGMPLECAGTHYVGIAGVGADAIEVKDYNDPAMIGKLGVFGYDRMTPLKKIEEGRGLSNTVFLIRVPHDGAAGITPWMAGGGSTVRTVPEKNSLEPFLSTEANGDRGTYVVM